MADKQSLAVDKGGTCELAPASRAEAAELLERFAKLVAQGVRPKDDSGITASPGLIGRLEGAALALRALGQFQDRSADHPND